MNIDYKEAYVAEGFGHYGNFGIKILIGIDRDFTDEDKSNIQNFANKITTAITNQTIQLDKKTHLQKENNRHHLLALFSNYSIYVEETKNEYLSDETGMFPWYIVTTKFGRIKIGWRKSVINIDWTDSDIKSEPEDIFADEDVTKGPRYIHAHGYETAKKYIDKLFKDHILSIMP